MILYCIAKQWKEERDKTRLSSDEQWDGVPKLEEVSTNGTLQSASPGVGSKVPHLKCFYNDAHSMRNKQEELESLAHSQKFVIIGTGESWWDESCDWNALPDGCRLFRRHEQGKRGVEVLHCM